MAKQAKIVFPLLFLSVTTHFANGRLTGTDKPSGNSNHFEPQVLPLCDKQSNGYVVESTGEWTYDPSSTVCAKTNMDILKVCQSVYTHRVITNIVQSNKYVKIDMCNSKKRNCTPLWAKPYRCLESPFQSDALLVPSPCIFDHIHNSSQCWPSDPWNATALASCNSRTMDLKSYAVLLPCGVGLFTGVEFVCCPRSQPPVADDKENMLGDDSTYDDDDDDDDYADDDIYKKPATTSTTTTTTTTTTTSTTTTEEPQTDEYYKRYDSSNEHSNFKMAEHRLASEHRNRISHVMKDWNELESKYQTMKEKDPIEAENFKSSMTLKFQRTIKALEAEATAEKKQMLAVHQQRVLSHINELKKQAMECFTTSLAVYQEELQSVDKGRSPKTDRPRHCLEKLMRALHKDRHHTISHFRHLVRENPNEALNQKDMTINRLVQISTTARQAVQMLDRYDELNRSLRPMIEDYVLSLQGRDDPPGSLLTGTRDSETILIEQMLGNAEMEAFTSSSSTSSPSPSTSDSSTSTTNVPDTVESVDKQPGSQRLEDDTLVDSSTSDSRIDFEPMPLPSHSQQSPAHYQPSMSVRRTVIHRESKSTFVAMGFAGIAIFGAMVIGLIVLRRRNPRHQGFLEVNTMNGSMGVTTPEEKHVVNMQINGYENPTYKYFETKE